MEKKVIKNIIVIFIFLFIGVGAVFTLLGSIVRLGTVIFDGILPGAICFFIAGGLIIVLIIFEVKVKDRKSIINNEFK